jgi:uncharacterized Zn-finger protein
MSETNTKQPIKVKSSDLPYYCPPRNSSSATMHPRVYMKFDGTGHAKCPYCGARYVIED